MNLNFKPENWVRDNILKLTPYSSAREENADVEGIWLDANESPFGTYNRYPDPYQNTLIEKLACIKNIPRCNLLLSNGSDELIDWVIRISCQPQKHKILTFGPTYGMYKVAAEINDVEMIEIPLNENYDIDYQDVERFISNVDLKLIIICSPNNPLGNNLDKEIIIKIIENFDGVVLLDEAYADFSSHGSLSELIKKYPNVIISQTLSKAYGMAGLRIGIGIMDEHLIKYFYKIKAPYNISSVNQEIALHELDNLNKINENINIIIKERERLVEELSKFKVVEKIYPSQTNFLLVQFTNAEKIFNHLKSNGIIVRNRSSLIPQCLRISVGTKLQNDKLINELLNLND